MKNNKGFTLVEIITTLVIIGIISSISIPKIYDYYLNIKILSASKQIVADIRYAQSFAMKIHDSTWVEFDLANNLYKIYSGKNLGSRTLIKDHYLQQDFVKYLDQEEYTNVTITHLNIDPGQSIAFDWFGNTHNFGDIVLNNSRTIRIEKVTGFVQIIGW